MKTPALFSAWMKCISNTKSKVDGNDDVSFAIESFSPTCPSQNGGPSVIIVHNPSVQFKKGERYFIVIEDEHE